VVLAIAPLAWPVKENLSPAFSFAFITEEILL
jgi:hypothetical protein